MPALLWRTSTAPASANTASAKASTASGSLTSTEWARAEPICAATASALPRSMSAAWTVAPRRPKSSAVERPIPEPAPVTTTVWPANSATRAPYRLGGCEGARAVLAGALCLVEGGVRPSEELLAAGAVHGIGRHADADAQRHREIALGHRLAQALGHGERVLGAKARHQDAELLAAHAE